MRKQAREDALLKEFWKLAMYHKTPHEFYSVQVGAKTLHSKDTAILFELFKKAKQNKP